MALYTDTQVLAVFPDAANLAPDQIAQATQDAAAVYDHATRNAGIAEADLRSWGERKGIDPDRMTRALTLLQQAGKLFSLPEPGPLALPAASAPAPERKPRAARRRATQGKRSRASSQKRGGGG